MACRGWQSWAEGSTSTADDRTRGTSTTKEYLRNSEHDSAHATYSSSNGYGFPSFDDVPDFFSSNPTYQPAVHHDSTSTYSANHHDSNGSNGNGYHSSSWDSSPSHHSTTSDNADDFHSSSYEEAGGGFFYDQGSQDVSGESAYSFYPSGAYSNGSSAGRAFGSSPSSVGYSANGAGNHYSSYQAPHDAEGSGSKHSDQGDEEEQEGGSGGFFNPAFAAAFQAALQRTAESE